MPAITKQDELARSEDASFQFPNGPEERGTRGSVEVDGTERKSSARCFNEVSSAPGTDVHFARSCARALVRLCANSSVGGSSRVRGKTRNRTTDRHWSTGNKENADINGEIRRNARPKETIRRIIHTSNPRPRPC